MREVTARAEPIEATEAMRLGWFEFKLGRAVVTVDTHGAHGDGSIETATMELHMTIRTRKGSTIAIEKIDMVEFAKAWAQSIMDD